MPVPLAFAATDPVVERISPDFTACAVPAPVVKSVPVGHVAPALVVENISPALAKYATPDPVVEYIAPAPAAAAPRQRPQCSPHQLLSESVFSGARGKLRRTSSHGGIHFFRFRSVYTYFHHGVHRTSCRWVRRACT